MKKIFFMFLLFLTFIFAKADEIDIEAESAILIEASTGKVLFEKNSKEKMAPASMTKMMSMLLIMEALNNRKISLDDEVYISKNASNMGGSQVYLEEGTSYKCEELLKSVAIASANDSVVALSEHISGTTSNFIREMNKKCQSLGCVNTNFVNVHGLDDENHYSCSYDMSLIARELLKHEEILKYTSIYEAYLNKKDGTSTWMVNTNKLIKFYNGLDGLKTGYTTNAGYCLTATAKKNDLRLISVVMKEKTNELRNNDTINILNYGYSNYKIKRILDKDKILGQIYIPNGKITKVGIKLKEDVSILENINDEKKYTYEINVNKVKAPLKVGNIVGKLNIISDNKVISNYNITVNKDVKKANIWDLYKRNINSIIIGI